MTGVGMLDITGLRGTALSHILSSGRCSPRTSYAGCVVVPSRSPGPAVPTPNPVAEPNLDPTPTGPTPTTPPPTPPLAMQGAVITDMTLLPACLATADNPGRPCTKSTQGGEDAGTADDDGSDVIERVDTQGEDVEVMGTLLDVAAVDDGGPHSLKLHLFQEVAAWGWERQVRHRRTGAESPGLPFPSTSAPRRRPHPALCRRPSVPHPTTPGRCPSQPGPRPGADH
jgi:hypothetical protein